MLKPYPLVPGMWAIEHDQWRFPDPAFQLTADFIATIESSYASWDVPNTGSMYKTIQVPCSDEHGNYWKHIGIGHYYFVATTLEDLKKGAMFYLDDHHAYEKKLLKDAQDRYDEILTAYNNITIRINTIGTTCP